MARRIRMQRARKISLSLKFLKLSFTALLLYQDWNKGKQYCCSENQTSQQRY
jgi:hypothetical protein